jgi:uncharacterized HAD superfamily protein
MKIKVGIDLDDVLTPTHEIMLEKAREELGIIKTIEDCTDYWLPKTLGLTDEHFQSFCDKLAEEGLLLNMPLFPEAKAVLDKYSDLIEPYFITSRQEKIMDYTHKWLASTGLTYNPDNVYSSIKKAELAVKLGLDLFIEDKGENAVELARKDIPVLLMRYPWNASILNPQYLNAVDYDAYIVPVNSWQDIDFYFQGWLSPLNWSF